MSRMKICYRSSGVWWLGIYVAIMGCGSEGVRESAGEMLTFTNLFSSGEYPVVACYRIPSMVTATSGDVLVAIDERVPSCADLGQNDDINIVMRRSTDDGATWQEIETIVDYPDGISASDPSMIVDQMTGAIFLFYNYMDVRDEAGVYHLMVMRSEDHGHTWSTPVDMTDQITKPAWHSDFKFITSGRGIQTADGRLLHTLVNLAHGMHVFGSDDHGDSWYLVDHALEPGDESKIIELADGRWMVNSRANGHGLRYVHISDDQGASWTTQADSALIDPGCNASIMRYQDSDLLLFSNARSTGERKNLTIMVSHDNGHNWREALSVYAGGSAYSTMTILDDGAIGLLFEKDNYAENAFVKIPAEKVIGGM